MRNHHASARRLRCVCCAAVVVTLLPAMSAQAQHHFRGQRRNSGPQYCPPQYEWQDSSSPYQSAPGNSQDAPPPSEDGAAQNPSAAPSAIQPPGNTNDLNLMSQNDSALSQGSGDDGANVGHIGRADNFGRFNIFDSQSALPMNRVWYGAQVLSKYDVTNNFGGVTTNQWQHRMGGEMKITDYTSVSFQTQYTDVTSSTLFGGQPIVDSWSNPQAMLKQVLYQDCDLVLSATLSVQFPIGGVDFGEFRESTTRLAPGMLFYYNTSENIFNYGGFQFNVPLTDFQVTTFDWSIGTGYWLYQSCCCCDWIQKISAQYEVFGKHVLGSAVADYHFNLGGIGLAVPVTEAGSVIDMTWGFTAFLRNNWRAAVGYSMPVSSGFARKNELICTVGYFF